MQLSTESSVREFSGMYCIVGVVAKHKGAHDIIELIRRKTAAIPSMVDDREQVGLVGPVGPVESVGPR